MREGVGSAAGLRFHFTREREAVGEEGADRWAMGGSAREGE
jgi:hypothetical protein